MILLMIIMIIMIALISIIVIVMLMLINAPVRDTYGSRNENENKMDFIIVLMFNIIIIKVNDLNNTDCYHDQVHMSLLLK